MDIRAKIIDKRIKGYKGLTESKKFMEKDPTVIAHASWNTEEHKEKCLYGTSKDYAEFLKVGPIKNFPSENKNLRLNHFIKNHTQTKQRD